MEVHHPCLSLDLWEEVQRWCVGAEKGRIRRGIVGSPEKMGDHMAELFTRSKQQEAVAPSYSFNFFTFTLVQLFVFFVCLLVCLLACLLACLLVLTTFFFGLRIHTCGGGVERKLTDKVTPY